MTKQTPSRPRTTAFSWARGTPPGESATRYLDGRLPLLDVAKGAVRKVFPDHWSFLLGELALYSLVVLLLTGVYLTAFFRPSMGEIVYHGSYQPLSGVRMTEAYSSVLGISFDVRGGLLIRQIHHWGAVVFTTAIGVHMLRVFFTGAFRRPRELNWLLGLTLFILALLEGFSGYSLPDDLLSGEGLRIAEGVMLSIPLAGTYLSFFVFGGEYPGHEIVPRLYSVHILLVPGLIVALVGAHLQLVYTLKHTQWGKRGRTNRNVVGMPFFPQFLARTLGLFLTVFGVLAAMGALAQVNPVWAFGPYRPDAASTGSQPDWYMGFLEGALRLMPAAETRVLGHTVDWGALVPAVLLPGLIFTALYVYPFAERWITRSKGEHHLCDRPRNQPTRTGLGVAGLVFYVVLLIAGGDDVIVYTFGLTVNAFVWTFRILLLVLPPLAFLLTKRICLALQAHDHQRLLSGEESGDVVQSVEGGFTEGHRPLTVDQRYVLLLRDIPEPLDAPPDGPRVARLRSALSGWFHQDRVELPGTEEQREKVASAIAPPGHQENP